MARGDEPICTCFVCSDAQSGCRSLKISADIERERGLASKKDRVCLGGTCVAAYGPKAKVRNHLRVAQELGFRIVITFSERCIMSKEINSGWFAFFLVNL